MIRIYWAPSADPKMYENKMFIFESTEIYDCVFCTNCWQVKHNGGDRTLGILKKKKKDIPEFTSQKKCIKWPEKDEECTLTPETIYTNS